MKPWFVAFLPIAYLAGSVPFGWLVAKLVKGVDLRQHGSGNIGATNAARVLGWKFFPLVFVLDFGKGFGPTFLAHRLAASGAEPSLLTVVLTGLCCIIGHVFSVFLRFKGGKAVATGCGVFTALAPLPVLAAVGVWLAVFALWRYVSLASICASVALVAASALLLERPFSEQLPVMVFAALTCILVVVLHRSNIRRLLAGTESRVGGRRK